MKILLATDGSKCSDTAVEQVAARPWPANTEVRIISIVESPYAPSPEPWAVSPEYYEKADEEARAQAQAALEKAAARLNARQEQPLRVTTEVLRGSPKREIVEEAERWQADLIVVGSHGYRSWERMLLGSVSQAVALHAECSVEIVRCKNSS